MDFDDENTSPEDNHANRPQIDDVESSEQGINLIGKKDRNIEILFEFPIMHVHLKSDTSFKWGDIVEQSGKYIQTQNKSSSKKEVPSKIVNQPIVEPDKSINTLSMNTEIESMIKLLCKNTQSYRLNSREILFQEGKLNEVCKRIKCNRCKKILTKCRLSCGHLTCFYCMKSSVSNLIREKTLEKLKKCRCKECLKLVSYEDIEKLFHNSPDIDRNAYKQLKINKNCVWCKRTLNVMVEYATELECLHICRECYTIEAISGAKKCILCQDPFKKLKDSKKGTLKCKICQTQGNQIKDGYWAVHLDHHVCLKCAGQMRNDCLVCGAEMTKNEKNLFFSFIQKYCIGCSQTHHLAEFIYCKKCANFACSDCLGSKNCLRCG